MSAPSPPAPDGMGATDGLFPADAVVRRVDRELILLLGGGRALLMQLAHPGVARGVAEHSDYSTHPLARLERTLAATYTVVFGPAEQARRVGAAVRAVHGRIAGPGYRATDPELLLWVHATLVDTALVLHDRFLRPLDPVDAERYYQESTAVAEVFGLSRADQPEDLAAFRRYTATMVDRLAAGLDDRSRCLAWEVLHPQLPVVTAPIMAAMRGITSGLLPGRLRAAYGLRWDRAGQVAFDVACLVLRTALPLVPAGLRQFPVGAIRTWPDQPGGAMLLSTCVGSSAAPSS